MGNVPATTEYNTFRKELTQYEKSVIKVLDEKGDVTPNKFMVMIENMVRKTPKLLECDRGTLFASILTAAEFGLEPNTPAGLSWIIPYNSPNGMQAQFQIGYQGIVNLLYRNDKVTKIMAEIVYEHDQFDKWIDESMNWKFMFKPAETERGNRRGVFAIIHISNAEPIFSYLSSSQVDEIKEKSKSPQTYGHANDPQGWMWKKAAVKQASKLAPKNHSVISNAINVDSMIDGGATLLLDENGKVIVSKPKEHFTSERKMDIVFGKTDEAQVVDGEDGAFERMQNELNKEDGKEEK